MALTISLENLNADIQRHLSIIGKRLYDKNGKNIFSNITLSSIEPPILTQYVSAAAQNVAGAIAQFVTSYSNTSITIDNSRWDTSVSTALSNAIRSYAVLFCVGEYLAMAHPELSDKYYHDAQLMMNTIVSTAFYKKPPSSSASINPTSTVTS
jgi:hypothetical protein